MREQRWKKITSKKVFEDRWFKARADACQFPDGRIIDPYYVVELPNWANAVVVTSNNEIVLVKQYRYPVDAVTLELPGGVINDDEDPMLAALRETQEETGYTSNQIQLICKTAPNPAINDNTAYFYLIENAVPTAHTNPDFFEDIEVVLYSKSDFIQLLQQNKIMHGVQLGPIYEALIQLGWLQYS
jgi:8-oxo-dGTP pyrophosphatase MutT (NUDIX family)